MVVFFYLRRNGHKKGIEVENVLNVRRLKKKFNSIFLKTKNSCILVYTRVHLEDH